jgi:hypothetical protein
MSTLKAIVEAAGRSRLEFIVCGGLAVNAYQVMRKTGDIDLVIREREAVSWKERLLSLGYAVFHETGAFVQLRPASPGSWPVDLIVVDEATFDAMKAAAKPFQFGDVECLIPSFEHLIAMKLHATRCAGEDRLRQDAVDMVELSEREGLELEGDALRSCAIAMPTRPLRTGYSSMPESRRAEHRAGILSLPVPDEPLAPLPQGTVEMILAASAEMLPVWNADPANEERRLARKSGKRFSLAARPSP